jgi:hypothetical protein
VVAFGRFLQALDRRRAKLPFPVETTIAADGGNISKQLLLRLERDPRYYGADALAALRALADTTWVPSQRTPRQDAILRALGLAARLELGTTLANAFAPRKRGRPAKHAA